MFHQLWNYCDSQRFAQKDNLLVSGNQVAHQLMRTIFALSPIRMIYFLLPSHLLCL